MIGAMVARWYHPLARLLIRGWAPWRRIRPIGWGLSGVLAYHLGHPSEGRPSDHAPGSAGVAWPGAVGTAEQAYATMGANFLQLFAAATKPERALAASPTGQSGVATAGGRPASGRGLADPALAAGTAAAAIARLAGRCMVSPRRSTTRSWMLSSTVRGVLSAWRCCSRPMATVGGVTAMRAVKDGVPLGLLADQGPRPGKGVAMYFLGQPTFGHQGPAFFARRCDSAVIPGVVVRTGAGRFRSYTGRPLMNLDDDTAAAHADSTAERLDLSESPDVLLAPPSLQVPLESVGA